MARRLCTGLCLWIVLLAAIPDVPAAELVTVAAGKRREVITLSTGAPLPPRAFILAGPDRLAIDIPARTGKPAASLPASYSGALITRLRAGWFDPRTWRLVFDLRRPVRVLEVKEGAKKGQWTITIAAREGKSAPEKPVRRAEKPMIVIDPGHGGVDPGAEGPRGTQEKDVVLDYARELQMKLLKTGRYRVLLTREGDEIVELRRRVEIARKARAGLFISLHADASLRHDARGLSVYTVSEKASDEEAEKLAARENKADVLIGVNLADAREDVAGILISLAERETKNRSATLADLLVTSLDDRVRLLPNSHRFAGFAVLKAPDIPSVLVEIGFLSHPQEEKLINSKSYRKKVIDGIVTGIGRYFAQDSRMETP